ncbi:MAG: sugar-binding protein [Bacteroidota bacterium]
MKTKILFLFSLMMLVVSVSAIAAQDFTADSVAGKIVIDGNLDDWAVNGKPKSAALDFGTEEQLVRQSGWVNPADSSGKIYLNWTQEYLVVAADITDDAPALCKDTTGIRIDSGDSIGLTFLMPDYTSLMIEMTPYPENGDWKQAILFRQGITWTKFDSTAVVRAKAKADGKGYFFEAAIPFKELVLNGQKVDPAAKSVPFTVILTDCDNGIARESVLQHNRTAANKLKSWFKQPNEFATLNFAGSGEGSVTW